MLKSREEEPPYTLTHIYQQQFFAIYNKIIFLAYISVSGAIAIHPFEDALQPSRTPPPPYNLTVCRYLNNCKTRQNKLFSARGAGMAAT